MRYRPEEGTVSAELAVNAATNMLLKLEAKWWPECGPESEDYRGARRMLVSRMMMEYINETSS